MTEPTLRALSLAFPEQIVDNDMLRTAHPDLVDAAAQQALARTWSADEGAPSTFVRAMGPYLSDPFRGARRRRWRRPGETAQSLEERACADALQAAGRTVDDVDLLICCSFFPDIWGVGNAAPLALGLGLTCPAWNLESACSSGLVALSVADAMMRAGRAQCVLIATSCSYSTTHLPDTTLRWGDGDGAAAMVMTMDGQGARLQGHAVRNTVETVGALRQELVLDGNGDPFVKLALQKGGASKLRDTAELFITETVDKVWADAGCRPADIQHWVFPTPTAWYAAFCAEMCQVPPEAVVNVHPETANVGPVLPLTGLYFTCARRGVKPGDRVLVYAVGSVSNAAAAVLEWGDVALGPEPPGFDSVR